jgi:hypothetical protein
MRDDEGDPSHPCDRVTVVYEDGTTRRYEVLAR